MKGSVCAGRLAIAAIGLYVMSSAWLAASTALLGTGLGLIVGELRARRDNEREEATFYRDRRREAYEQLWRITEQAHVTARIEARVRPEEQIELLGTANSFAMLNAVYIDAADRQLAHNYLQSVLTFLSLLAETAEGRRYRGISLSTTQFPEDFGPTVQHLSEALKLSRQLGSELRSRVRTALGGPSPKPIPPPQPINYGRNDAAEMVLPPTVGESLTGGSDLGDLL
jgi:hypothetical protein